MKNRMRRLAPTNARSFFRGYCKAAAAATKGVNGKGGGINEANDNAQATFNEGLHLYRLLTNTKAGDYEFRTRGLTSFHGVAV